MNIQIFGKSKCFDTKKAERYFKERRIKYQFIDILRYGMSRGELNSVKNAVGLEAILLLERLHGVFRAHAEIAVHAAGVEA